MNKDTITRWLESADALPEASEVTAIVKAWPWFVPARHMETALLHERRPFSKEVLNNLNLYGGDWVSAYRLLSLHERSARKKSSISEVESTTPQVDAAAEPAIVSELVQELSQPAIVEEVPEYSKEATAEPIIEQAPEPIIEKEIEPEEVPIPALSQHQETPLIQPLYTEDYFRHQGIETEAPLPEPEVANVGQDPKTLMVMMSFTEWLTHFKVKSDKEQEEEREKSALRSMWQREKLAAALDEEPEEIPEDVFEMAVSSITREDDLVSESLAEILEKQEKWDAATEMYRKLGLRNPSKSAYFALRAEAVKKKKI
jgi:hypothetical protein